MDYRASAFPRAYSSFYCAALQIPGIQQPSSPVWFSMYDSVFGNQLVYMLVKVQEF